MSIKSQGHSLILVEGHSDFKIKCLTFGLYTQVSDSWPQGPLVNLIAPREAKIPWSLGHFECNRVKVMGKTSSSELSCTCTDLVTEGNNISNHRPFPTI